MAKIKITSSRHKEILYRDIFDFFDKNDQDEYSDKFDILMDDFSMYCLENDIKIFYELIDFSHVEGIINVNHQDQLNALLEFYEVSNSDPDSGISITLIDDNLKTDIPYDKAIKLNSGMSQAQVEFYRYSDDLVELISKIHHSFVEVFNVKEILNNNETNISL
jgi:hypothetical protein